MIRSPRHTALAERRPPARRRLQGALRALLPAIFLAALALPLAGRAADEAPADRLLFRIAEPVVPATVKANKTTLAVSPLVAIAGGEEGLALDIAAETTKGYPGVFIPPDKSGWDLSDFGRVRAELANTGDKAIEVSLRVDAAGDWQQSPWSDGVVKLAPGEAQRLEVVLGLYQGKPSAKFDRAKVVGLTLFVVRGGAPASLRVGAIHATGAPVAIADPNAPAAPVEPATEPLQVLDFTTLKVPGPELKLVGSTAEVVELKADADMASTKAGKALRVELGGDSSWPGVTFFPLAGMWNFAAYKGIEADITNEGEVGLQLCLRVDNHGADGNRNCNTEKLYIPAGQTRTLSTTFGRSWGQPAFALNPAKVISILIFSGKHRDPVSFTVHEVRAFVADRAAEMAKIVADGDRHRKDPPPVKRVSTTYPAALDFESEAEPRLWDTKGGSTTVADGEVIGGTRSLLGDSRTSDKKWFEFFTTRPGLFVPGFTYTVTLKYRVLHADPGAKAYALLRSHSQGWGRWDRSWTDFKDIQTSPDTVRTVTFSAGLDVQNDYQLMFGISGEAALVYDDVTITQGAPYEAPDLERDRIAAIPADAETVGAWDFESDPKNLRLNGNASLIAAGKSLIAGKQSLLANAMGAKGDWNSVFVTENDILPGGYRYFIHLKSRALEFNGKAPNAFMVAKRQGVKGHADIAWKRWRGPENRVVPVYMSFDVQPGEKAGLQLGIYRQGSIVVDDFTIRRIPLPDNPNDTREPMVRTDANLIWSDEFNGPTLDTSLWSAYNEPRTGGWWSADDAYTDGEGSLVLRFRKQPQGYTFGGLHTADRFSFTYGYAEARMKLPTQEGFWPAFWLMGKRVGNVDGSGKDGTEVDIMEAPWRGKNEINHALHWDGYNLDHQASGSVSHVPGIETGWHTYAVDWAPEGYIFYIDGKEMWRTSDGGVCENPLYLILSLEKGGWAGNPDKATLPDYTYVDYVRIWQDPTTPGATRSNAPKAD